VSDLHVKSCIRDLQGEVIKVCDENFDIARRDIPTEGRVGHSQG
jgi:hypothetical protein